MQPVASADFVAVAELDDFDALVRTYWPKVFRFALASLRDPDAAGTVAQDCLMRAHRKAAGFRGESSVNTWLMQIAVNLVRDYARNRRLQFWKRTRECAVNWDDVGRRWHTGDRVRNEAPRRGSRWRPSGRPPAGFRNDSARYFCCGSWRIWICWKLRPPRV